MPPGDLGAARVGRTVLYWWPGDDWQRGIVAVLCSHGTCLHVVAYTRQTSALRCTADKLLDAAPTAPTGCFSRQLGRRVTKAAQK